MSTWIIQDWMSKHVFTDKTFNSYGDARDFITEYANENSKTADEMIGICEDLYAINIDDNGNVLPDEGQYTV